MWYPMKIKIFEKVTRTLNKDVSAIIDTWEPSQISPYEFEESIPIGELAYLQLTGVRAWIIDLSETQGDFANGIAHYFTEDLFLQLATNNFKFVIIIEQGSKNQISTDFYTSEMGSYGVSLIKTNSIHRAVEWLKYF